MRVYRFLMSFIYLRLCITVACLIFVQSVFTLNMQSSVKIRIKELEIHPELPYPLTELYVKEVNALLKESVSKLPEKCRLIFMMSRYQNMKNQEINLTTAQFAAIHEVNPRTLHYYDSVGLFSPERKGENQYRYYTSRQSIDFEYIRMLKELNMSIREIRSYVQEPGPDKFMELANGKNK